MKKKKSKRKAHISKNTAIKNPNDFKVNEEE